MCIPVLSSGLNGYHWLHFGITPPTIPLWANLHLRCFMDILLDTGISNEVQTHAPELDEWLLEINLLQDVIQY